MEVVAPVVTALLMVAAAAVWMYAVLHPLFNHRQVGVAMLMLAILVFARDTFAIATAPILYVILHDCRDRRAQTA